MNVGRVFTLVQDIRALDSKVRAQQMLSELRAGADSLANEPQNQGLQSAFVEKLKTLRTALVTLEGQLNTGQREFLQSIGALDLFTEALADQIQDNIRDNGIAPAVVRTLITEAENRRQTVLANFDTLVQSLKNIGVEKDTLEPGEAEVGFLVPRELFDNKLKGLSKEI